MRSSGKQGKAARGKERQRQREIMKDKGRGLGTARNSTRRVEIRRDSERGLGTGESKEKITEEG